MRVINNEALKLVTTAIPSLVSQMNATHKASILKSISG